MKRTFAIILSALISAPAIADFDFKGIAIGKSTDRATVESALGISCGKGESVAAVCFGKSTIGGEKASTLVRIGGAGNVERITVIFSASTFDLLEQEFLKKFGPPKTSRSQVKTGAGATLESVKHVWTADDGSIVSASKNTSKAGDAHLLMNTKSDLESLKKGIETRKSDL